MELEHPSYYDNCDDERLYEEYAEYREEELAKDEESDVMSYDAWQEEQLARIADFLEDNEPEEECI